MPCRHLRDLYDICSTHSLKFSSSDLIRIFCPECGVAEACPSVLFEEYEKQHPGSDSAGDDEESSLEGIDCETFRRPRNRRFLERPLRLRSDGLSDCHREAGFPPSWEGLNLA